MQDHLISSALELKQVNHALTFEFCSADSGIAISKVEAGLLDAALVFRSSYFKGLEETRLYSGQFEVVVDSKHPILSTSKKELVKELNQLPAITFRTSTGPNFWEKHPSFKQLGIIPQHTYFYEDTETALRLLKKTKGWAFVPDLVLKKNKSIRKISFDKKLNAPVDISLVCHRNFRQTAFMAAFTEVVKLRLTE